MKILEFIIAIVVSNLAGLIGGLATAPAIPGWYAGLNKPSFNPPGWIFGPVWTLLYTLMGVALFFAWQKRSLPGAKLALATFAVQLALNALWSLLFFGLKNPGLAFIEIILLWLVILVTIILFYKLDHRASYLLLPYILWVSFAAILNFSIWRLN